MGDLTIFRQLIFYLPRDTFKLEVAKFEANRYVKTFDTWSHFLVLLAAQIKGWDSLRAIESGFSPRGNLIYHIGIKSLPKRSNLAKANKNRSYKIFEKTFYELLREIKERLEPKKLKVRKEITLFDSTVITVSLKLFKWAKFRRQGGFKIHTAYSLNRKVPTYAKITHGNKNDVEGFKELEEYKGGIVVFDRGYSSFDIFKKLDENGCTFVTRLKKDIKYQIITRKQTKGAIRRDIEIKFTGSKVKRKFKGKLRAIKFYDKENEKELEFLTNEFRYSASTIAYLYKKRWEIELFFKWIKQNLKIKRYLGTTENAVKVQVWVGLIAYLLLSYVQAKCNYEEGMIKFTRIVREMLFEEVGLLDLMSDKIMSKHMKKRGINPAQLDLGV